MSELIQMVQEQGQEIKQLKSMIKDLTILMMKGKVDDTWVSEDVAADMLGYSDPRTLRKLVKDAKIAIEFRNTNGRNYQYNRKSIMKFKDLTSTIN